MSKIKRILIIICVALSLNSCEELTMMLNQVNEIVNLKNCNFDVSGISNINMLGINLSNGMDKTDLNASQLLKVTNALLQKKLPVTFNVNIDVDNPNAIAASLGKMDYIIGLNGNQIISSTFNQGFSIPANSNGSIAIPISTDLFQLFSGETADAILNLAFKLAGCKSDPVNLGVQVKPYITINNQQLAYPDYITIDKILE